MTKANIKIQIESVARADLLDIITKDTKLIIVIKSISNSGISRRMRVIANNKDITYYIGNLCDLSRNNTGLLIKGCGMDMTFWLANYITTCLWGKKKPKWLKGNNGTCLEWLAV